MRIGLFIVCLLFLSLSSKASCNLQPRFSYQTKGLTVSFTNKSAGNYQTARWQFSDGTVSNELSPKHTFTNAGRYTFSLTISNPEGCSETFEGKLYVFDIKHKTETEEALPNQTNLIQQPAAATENARSIAGNNPVSNAAVHLVGSLTNMPNPFNANTNIQFELAGNSRVEVGVYDLNGRLVRILANETMNGGTQNILFERNNLPSGMYMIMVKTSQNAVSHKIMIN
ncbi:T9SS C-terminal target domain-containing protein [Sphingobacteriales bacterium UPWRP_1]|nr:hypothetical protein B6N25_04720 [Sphingobacteriales bacterium TSM_CSS]PSJ78264.1 T9SS C-terminal target domain-containing protein [Sphingobacteriales bacterium UPWRP_1]